MNFEKPNNKSEAGYGLREAFEKAGFKENEEISDNKKIESKSEGEIAEEVSRIRNIDDLKTFLSTFIDGTYSSGEEINGEDLLGIVNSLDENDPTRADEPFKKTPSLADKKLSLRMGGRYFTRKYGLRDKFYEVFGFTTDEIDGGWEISKDRIKTKTEKEVSELEKYFNENYGDLDLLPEDKKGELLDYGIRALNSGKTLEDAKSVIEESALKIASEDNNEIEKEESLESKEKKTAEETSEPPSEKRLEDIVDNLSEDYRDLLSKSGISVGSDGRVRIKIPDAKVPGIYVSEEKRETVKDIIEKISKSGEDYLPEARHRMFEIFGSTPRESEGEVVTKEEKDVSEILPDSEIEAKISKSKTLQEFIDTLEGVGQIPLSDGEVVSTEEVVEALRTALERSDEVSPEVFKDFLDRFQFRLTRRNNMRSKFVDLANEFILKKWSEPAQEVSEDKKLPEDTKLLTDLLDAIERADGEDRPQKLKVLEEASKVLGDPKFAEAVVRLKAERPGAPDEYTVPQAMKDAYELAEKRLREAEKEKADVEKDHLEAEKMEKDLEEIKDLRDLLEYLNKARQDAREARNVYRYVMGSKNTLGDFPSFLKQRPDLVEKFGIGVEEEYQREAEAAHDLIEFLANEAEAKIRELGNEDGPEVGPKPEEAEEGGGEDDPEKEEILKDDFDSYDKNEKREKFEKRWDEMSDEEREEKYGESFEIREKIMTLRGARNKLAIIHEKRQGFLGKRYEEAYQEALADYEAKRAEYVGAKAWRVLKEKKSLAEEKAEVHAGGKFEKVRKAWRWMGDKNLDNFLKGTKFEAKSRPVKFLARVASLRTAASLSLLGVGAWAGAGIASLGALSARRAFSGTSTGLASYDLMRNISDNRALSFKEEDLARMSVDDMQQRMSIFEARARLSGKRIVRSEDYQSLRRAMHKRLKEGETEGDLGEEYQNLLDMTKDEFLEYLDDNLSKEETSLSKSDKRKKITATAIGLFVGSGMLGKMFGDKEGVPEGVSGDSPDIPNEVLEEAQSGPELVMERPGLVRAPDLSDPSETLSQVKEGGFQGFDVFGEEVKPGFSPDFGEKLSAVAENMPENIEGIASTIKEGGSLWQAGKELVKGGHITNEQFAEAWSSSESVVNLASGETVHISEAGLSHAGDQIVYVAATDSVPAHFEVVDYVKDGLHIGSNEDLVEAFTSQGKDVPEWLKGATESVGLDEDAEEAISKIIEDGDVPENMISEESFDRINSFREELGEELAEEPEVVKESIDKTVEENNTLVEEALEGSLEGLSTVELVNGSAEFIVNDKGKIVDVVIRDSFSLGQREVFVSEAVSQILRPNYGNIIMSDVTKMYDISSSLLADVVPNKMALAKEAAWEVFRLRELMLKLEPQSEAWLVIRDSINKIIKPSPILGNRVIYNNNFLNTEMFQDIKLPQ